MIDPGLTLDRQAEVYDALLGGKDNRPHDQELAAELLRIFPGAPIAARANEAFLRRAVRTLAKAGIKQFLTLGAGYPAEPHLHCVAADVAPGTRMVYVDASARVCTYLRVLCQAPDVRVIHQDPRNVTAVLSDPQLREVIKPDVLTAVIASRVLHFLTDEEAVDLIRALRVRLAPRSLMAFSAGTSDGLPAMKVDEAVQLYTEHVGLIRLRTKRELLGLLDGCAMRTPGLVRTYAWCPFGSDDMTLAFHDVDTPQLYAGLVGFSSLWR
ncbi:SAM-dependent methyltransferase [Nonomuraea angiospora]